MDQNHGHHHHDGGSRADRVTGNRKEYINSTVMAAVVEVFLNGLYTAIIVTTVCVVVSRHGFRHLLRPLILIISIMYIIATVSAWAQISMVAETFLSPRLSRDEVIAALFPSRWQRVFIALAYPVNGVAADCIMIWRCYVIWGRNKYIILIASILTFTQIPFVIMTLLYHLDVFTGYQASFQFFKSLALTSISLSLASTVLTTVLIMYRIITVGGKRYFPFIEVMVESALLYSITLIVFIPFGGMKREYGFVPAAVNRQMTGIAPTLIIARLLLGAKALERQFAATITTGTRTHSTATHNDTHPLSAVRFHPSFTDPTKTENDGVFSSGGDCDSIGDCYDSRTGGPSHTLDVMGSRAYSSTGRQSRGGLSYVRDEDGHEDDDDEDEDDRTSRVSSVMFENPLPVAPPTSGGGSSNANREPA